MKILPLNNQARFNNQAFSSGKAQSEKIAQALDDYVRSTQRLLEIKVDEGTGRIMVKVISKKDGKIIREIPSEDMVNLASKLKKMRGAVFNEKA